ncbi:Hypothetical_protein [Hexamita inflata]|uniref:Hypothetical_protein n=1 Tax=Hexamita inflata TaxID=28002 RepID=A0AA86V0N2_9EUKA|nr:Hypothetical protein HINF_LOCUS59521 [Hexamita inflata]
MNIVYFVFTIQNIDALKQNIENKLDQLIQLANPGELQSFVQSVQSDNGQDIFVNISTNILRVVNGISNSHAYFNKLISDSNATRLCTNLQIPSQYNSSVFNGNLVNDSSYSYTSNTSQNCMNLNLTATFHQMQSNNSQKSIIQYMELSGNTITYPYTSNNIPVSNLNKQILNFYGTMVKFIYPCRQFNAFEQPFDVNYRINNEQKFDFNSSEQFRESTVTEFIQELSEFKQKMAACYGEEYLSLGDNGVWAIGIEKEVIDFVGKTYEENQQIAHSKQLFDAINKTIAAAHHNAKFRVYKHNHPYGQGQSIGAASVQLFIKDCEFYETVEDALKIMAQYTEITANNQLLYNFEVIIFNQINNSNKSIYKLLSSVLNVTRIELKIDAYIAYQTRVLYTTDNYYLIPQSIDVFQQNVVQICSLVNSQNSLAGVICTSIPVQQLTTNQAQQYIVDTEKESCLTKNTDDPFDYKYFLATCEGQYLIHFNQYKRTSVKIKEQNHYFENINGYLRLIIKVREIDTYQYSLISSVSPTNVQFTFDQCVTQQTAGYIFNSNKKYNIDCANPSQTVTDIFSNQQDNLEAVLLLSDATFDQLQNLKSYLGLGVQVGRMSRNNLSTTLSDLTLSTTCLQQIQDYIYNFPNDEDFETGTFHLNQLTCQHNKNNQVKTENFTLLLNIHKNYLFTDYVLFSRDFAAAFFQLSSFNVLSPEMESVVPFNNSHLQLLFTEGAVLCRLIDKPDYLHKNIQFGSRDLKSAHFQHLKNMRGILFEMIPQDTITFNCSSSTFSNELMKNMQERADHYANAFVDDKDQALRLSGDVGLVVVGAVCAGIVAFFFLKVV